MTAVALKQSLTSPRFTRLAPYLALLGGMLSLAVGTSFAKSLFPVIGAEGTSAYRVGVAAIVLVALWRPWRFPLTRADLKAIALYGLVTGAMNLCFYMSLRTIPLGIALAIEFAGPLTLALLHSRRLIHFVWVGCTVAGLVMLLPLRSGVNALDPVGVGLAAAAGVC